MSNAITIVNPWTGQPALELPVDDDAHIARKVEDARRQADLWAQTALTERIALIERFISNVEVGADDIARAVTLQMGKPISESRGEVRGLVQRAKMMVSLAPDALRDQSVALGDGIYRSIVRDPLGVVFNIGAWNYPLLIVVNVVVPAVLAGNAVLLKHASQTAGVGLWFERMFREAGAPEGLVTALTVRGATASRIAQHPVVDGVFFTGSVEAGRAVYQAVGTRPEGFIDVGLELGGKDPAYVRHDMPLSRVVGNLVEGAMYNAGQSCCAVERIYVHRSLYDDFVESYVAMAQGLIPADPLLDDTRLGPVAALDTLDTLEEQVRDAVAKGATLHCGGVRVPGDAWSFPATVLSDCDHQMLLMTEESFGPVIGIMPVDSDEQAIALMNDTAYGLTASIWTADHRRGRELARQIRTGTAFINRCDYVDPALPWTGFGDTGKGITLSALGYHHLTRARGIHVRPLQLLG